MKGFLNPLNLAALDQRHYYFPSGEADSFHLPCIVQVYLLTGTKENLIQKCCIGKTDDTRIVVEENVKLIINHSSKF